jgi:peptidoglycan/LPS O-acetylase OafA/YrhL
MFFALSGFLVTGSASRLGLGPFALSRALRIVPALAVDTAVSILVLGLALTIVPKWAYLLSATTMAYWLNCFGYIHYTLPGVFVGNPWPQVNSSLWTIPGELLCYFSIAGLMVTRLIRTHHGALCGVVVLFLLAILYHHTKSQFTFPLERELAGPSGKLVCYFLMGSAFYLARDNIPMSPALAGGALLYILAFSFLTNVGFRERTLFISGACFCLPYLVIWLGLQEIRVPWPLNRGDYSYGIYLYAFPVQQSVVYLTKTHLPLAIMALSVFPVTALAMLSWHFVEKPTLRLRRLIAPFAAPR